MGHASRIAICVAIVALTPAVATANSYDVTELAVPAGFTVGGVDISNAGILVASAADGAGNWRGITWVGGTPSVIEPAGQVAGRSYGTFLWAINNQGVAIGSTPTALTGPRAATFDPIAEPREYE